MNDLLRLAPEPEERPQTSDTEPWKILVVDDEDEVHRITHLALSDFSVADRKLEFISAYSGAEAREKMIEHSDIALILLDVVMETDDAGLRFARFVRQELANSFVRIILRTGQPGMAPERHVLKVYDINDYRAKTELTQDRLYSVVYTALASYRDMMALARSRQQLVGVIDELETLSEITSSRYLSAAAEVVALSQNLATELDADLSVAQRQQVRVLVDSALQLHGNIHELARYARTGKYNEIRGTVALRDVFEKVCKRFSQELEEIEAEIAVDHLPTVIGSHRQLEQLLSHLLSNAIRFRSTRRLQVDVNAKRDHDVWRISIADNGMGMTEEEQQVAFSLFRRENRTSLPAASGIGLNICRKIVRWHGGDIQLFSDKDSGTTIELTFPVVA